MVLEGAGILYEDGGEIICNQYPVQMKMVTPATANELYEALNNGGGIAVNENIMLSDDSRFEYGMALANKGRIKLNINGTLSSGSVSGYSFGCMKVGEGTILNISAGENGKFVNSSSNSNVNIDNGKVVVNGGDFLSAGHCFLFYADQPNEKMELTINAGNFDAAWSVVSFPGGYKAKVTINGGTFKGEEGVVALQSGTGENAATVIISGGTFYNWDPSAYVNAETHTVTQSKVGSDTVYTVTAK